MAQAAVPTLNTDLSPEALKKMYWGLGKENKWMESIDGIYHYLGKTVFDEGLHGSTKEPGFIDSMEKSFIFVQDFLQSKIDADWYLKLHKVTCAHFNGKATNTLMGQEKVGIFRGALDNVIWQPNCSSYPVSKEAIAEFQALDRELKTEFGEFNGLGEIEDQPNPERPVKFCYKRMDSDVVRRIFDKFVKEFYQEIDKSTTADEKLWAIAGLHQRLEWLHPVKDGTSRTNIAMMNKLLTQYGFHPAILERPHVSSCNTRAQWKQHLEYGLARWDQLLYKFKRQRVAQLISLMRPDVLNA